MTYNFSIKDILNEVIRLSEEDPDFVYTTQPGREDTLSCGYAGREAGTTEGRSCIVGQALQNLGVPKDELVKMIDYADETITTHLNIHAKDSYDWDYLNKLTDIQLNQDKGLSWGDSVRKVIKPKSKE